MTATFIGPAVCNGPSLRDDKIWLRCFGLLCVVSDNVPLSRNELVSDWQSRLAVADSLEADAGRQPAWLARVQQRLYRFLLSLYGSGHWRASAQSGEAIEASSGIAPVLMFEAPQVLPLDGKPAKETGKIRAVLKSVAAAQDQPLAAGPLVAGLPAQYWVAVAIIKPQIDPTACVKLLRNHGLTVQVSNRGADTALEVLAAEHRAAIKLLLAQKRRDVFRQRAAALRIPPAVFWTLCAIVFAPVPAIAALLITEARYPDAFRDGISAEALLYALALFAAFFSVTLIRPLSRMVTAADRLVLRVWASLKRRIFRK